MFLWEDETLPAWVLLRLPIYSPIPQSFGWLADSWLADHVTISPHVFILLSATFHPKPWYSTFISREIFDKWCKRTNTLKPLPCEFGVKQSVSRFFQRQHHPALKWRVPMDARLLLYHRFTLGHVLPFVSHVLHYKQRFSSLVSYDRLHWTVLVVMLRAQCRW